MNGQKLQEIRESNNITRKQLAHRILVSESIVQSWEEGWYIEQPSSGEIDEMSMIFNVPEEQLRKILDLSEEDDSDDQATSLMDFVDASIRAVSYIKSKKQ